LPPVAFASFRNEQVRVYEADRLGDFVVFDSPAEKRGIVDVRGLSTVVGLALIRIRERAIEASEKRPGR
jgi:hypothetical protein